VREGMQVVLERAGLVGNPFWSPAEGKTHPRWLSAAARLQPKGGAGEWSARRLSTRLEVPPRWAQ
jgi:hypothetical protein